MLYLFALSRILGDTIVYPINRSPVTCKVSKVGGVFMTQDLLEIAMLHD